MILTGQDKLNEALHQEACDGKWALRVEDPCNGLKLDAIVDALGGTSTTVNTQIIFNETIVSANIEQSLLIPGAIIGYMIKSRDRGKVKLSHVSGESGTKYLTVKPGAVYTDEHRYNDLTLYFQSNIAGEVIEIVAWS